jgi:hypothetical protein
MELIDNKIIADYLVGPEELNKIISSRKNGNQVEFVSDRRALKNILELHTRYINIMSRYNANGVNVLYQNRKKLASQFSLDRFEQQIIDINRQLIEKYDIKNNVAFIEAPENASTLELILMKKALNKQGWIVMPPADDSNKYTISPRRKEYRTELNKNVRNYDALEGKISSMPIQNFYR